MSFQEVELKKIKPNRLNPRLEFGKEALDELADSIERSGLVQPLIVRPTADGYEVVVGERRYRASQQAGLDKVPAIVRKYTDDQVIELNLIENIQREDLTAIEKGHSVKSLMEKFPEKYPKHAAVAKAIGVSETSIRDWLLLVDEMAASVQRMVAPETPSRKVPEGKIDWATASVLAHRIKDKPKQVLVAKTLIEKGVRGSNARKIIQQVAKRPERPVEQVVKTVLEAPPTIPFMPEHADLIRKGIKTQTSRKGIDPKIKVGAKVEAYTKFADLKVVDVIRKRLGDFSEEDAKKEGGYTFEEFKRVWRKIHGEWNPNERVYVIHFRKAD